MTLRDGQGESVDVETLAPYAGRFYTVVGGTHRSAATWRGESEVDVVLARVESVAQDVAALTWRRTSGRTLPPWTPGAHIDLVLPDGRSTQYSLCGDPTDPTCYRIGVLRRDGIHSVSRAVHELRPGARLTIRGPRNHFALVPAPSYVFIAGGIGITPLLPMMRSVDRSGVRWRALYAGRTRSGMAFLPEVAGYGDRVEVWVDDERGTMVDLAALVRDAPSDAAIYCCGPTPMIDAVEELGARFASRRVVTERFSAVPVDRDDDSRFQVRCALSDVTVDVPPGASILQAVGAAGVTTVSSCGKGVCGTCETAVLEGAPDHRDVVLDEDEKADGDTMMICVSRSLTPRLVLDL